MNQLARRMPRWGLNVFAAAVLLFLFLPILWIVVFSFNQPLGKFNLQWQRFTLENWRDAFAPSNYRYAFVQSLKIAAISTSIATTLGAMIALALSRYRFRGFGLINLFLVLPLTTPEVVLGSSLATLFLTRDQTGGFTQTVIAHVMFQISFVALTVRARVRGFDWSLEQAAQDLGATPMRTFWKVTFPLILPGIAAAAMLSFALSLDDYIITLFNMGTGGTTFPLYINGAFQREFPPQVNVLASLILFVSVGLMLIGVLRGRLAERRGRSG